MSQSNPITINNFQKGVASSPYVGYGKMVGLDIFRKPGVIQAGQALVKTSDTFDGLVTAQVISIGGNVFLGTDTGKIYKNGTLLQNRGTPVHDMVIIQGYLIISFSQGVLDLYGNVDSGVQAYTANWNPTGWGGGLDLSVYGYKKMVVGKDGVVYIGNESKLASLKSFTPGVGTATATFNANILTTGIFNNKVIQSICEYGRNIAIMVGTGSYVGYSTLYLMDRGIYNANTFTFSVGIGVDIPERSINAIITQNNRLYFFGNDTGTFYTTNSTTYQEVAVLPGRIQGQSYTTTPNSISLIQNQIVIGIGGFYSSSYDPIYGVYGVRGNALVCKSIISTGGYGQTNQIAIGSIIPGGNSDSYHASWKDGNSYGVDLAYITLGTNYSVYFESPFYETGTAIKPRTFQTIQLNFGTNLTTGQQVRIKYRTASNGAWLSTTNNVFGFSTWGAVNSAHGNFPVTNTTNLQIRCEFDLGASPVYGTNIELQSIILI